MLTDTVTYTHQNGSINYKRRDAQSLAFHAETEERICKLLETLNRTGEKVRIFYGDTKTGKAWDEEEDILGAIGRSAGSIKVPLMCKPRAHGGAPILDHCVIGVRNKAGWLYKHEKFDAGSWALGFSNETELHFVAYKNGETIARFSTRDKAQNYIDFMQGTRFTK